MIPIGNLERFARENIRIAVERKTQLEHFRTSGKKALSDRDVIEVMGPYAPLFRWTVANDAAHGRLLVEAIQRAG